TSKIEIDTRFGVPTYADDEEPRYLLDGAELVPTDETDGPRCKTGGGHSRRYRARVEGAFAHILRCGDSPSQFHFEVHDRRGTLFIYGDQSPGDSAHASLASYAAPFGIFQWNLREVDDTHGNTTHFRYQVDDIVP